MSVIGTTSGASSMTSDRELGRVGGWARATGVVARAPWYPRTVRSASRPVAQRGVRVWLDLPAGVGFRRLQA